MKKLFCLATVCILVIAISNKASAQDNIVKLYPAGFMYNSGDGSGASYQFKWGYERVFTDKITGEFDMGVVVRSYKSYGFKVTDALFLAIDPQFNYYLLDDAPDGLYVGGFFSLGFGSVFMAGGVHVGYQYFFLDDRLALDGRIGFGGGGYVSDCDGCGGFHMPFEVGAGYRF